MPLGVILGVSGYPWARSARNRLQRPPPSFSLAPFYAILAAKGCPKGCQNEAKIDQKSIQKSIDFLVGFLIGFGMVLGQLLEGFWDLGPSKMSFWCRRGAIFQKFTFFWSDSFLE